MTIVYKEGNKKGVGKSVTHIHYHLIPEMKIGVLSKKIEKREIFAEEKYIKKIKDLKKRLRI